MRAPRSLPLGAALAGSRALRAAARSATLVAVVLPCACATRQTIALACVPERTQIYVDGERLEEIPPDLRLPAGEYHKIFVKAPGYEPRLILVEPLEEGAEPDAKPLCLTAELVPVERRIEVQLEEEEAP